MLYKTMKRWHLQGIEASYETHNFFLSRTARRVECPGFCKLSGISCNAEEGEAREMLVIVYRERKGAANMIYTFGLHTPRGNESEDVRLFHEFVSGFRVK